MVSRIEPDRYADTGFAVADTSPEINARIFAAVMAKAEGERLLMGLSMLATARKIVWSSIPADLPSQSGGVGSSSGSMGSRYQCPHVDESRLNFAAP